MTCDIENVIGSKVKVTETFSGGVIPIEGSPSTSVYSEEQISED